VNVETLSMVTDMVLERQEPGPGETADACGPVEQQWALPCRGMG
jgi:hypothetical protein